MADENTDRGYFKGPLFVEVRVPSRPAPAPNDHKRDFPPGEPPEVRYRGIRANYWQVIQDGTIQSPFGIIRPVEPEVLEWLRSIADAVCDSIRS